MPPGGGSHLSMAAVPSLSLRLLVYLPSGSRTCCTPWSVFQDGSDEAIRLPAAMAHKWRSPARDLRHGEHCTQSTSHGSLASGGPVMRRAPQRARAAHVPRSHRSIVRQGCKLSMRDVPSSTHLPLSPCRSGLTAAGPRSRGVRHCLGRPARDGLPHPLRLGFPGRLWGHCLGRNWYYRLQFAGAGTGDFKFELFPLRSPLLGESLLVSFPPLINILKFSG